MRIFKTTLFTQFSSEKSIQDDELRQAVKWANQGLIDANLGGNLIKQHSSRLNAGKSSGYRSIILYKVNQNVFSCMVLQKINNKIFRQKNYNN